MNELSREDGTRFSVRVDGLGGRVRNSTADWRYCSHTFWLIYSNNNANHRCSELSSGLYCRIKNECRPTFQRCVLPPSSGIRIGKIDWGDMKWIQLAQDRDPWWAVVNTVMNLRGSDVMELDTQHINCTHPWWWRQYAPLKSRSTIIFYTAV
jgi:hypothetical protein